MRTEVCITIDVEFSIGGAFRDPVEYAPIGEAYVTCPVDGREQGLGFILDTLGRHGLRGTFFVEALNHHYFGDAPMGAIAHRIAEAGQDVQLHLHPCWRYFRHADWKERLKREPPDDRCAGRSVEEAIDLIADGLATFERWGVGRPTVVRTGGLIVDAAFLAALPRCGVPMSSSVGLGIFRPEERELALAGGLARIGEAVEAPITSYADGATGRQRSLTITGTSWREMHGMLREAGRRGETPIVALTHPIEFVKSRDVRHRTLGRNRINQSRLENLCAFLAAHRDEFAAVAMGDSVEAWRAAAPRAPADLATPPFAAIGRMVENKANDLVWRL